MTGDLMKKKVLIVGASGFLGKRLFKEMQKKYLVLGTYNKNPSEKLVRLEMSDYGQVEKIFSDFSPDIVVHCAGITDVDLYETDPEVPKSQIAQAKNIARACEKYGAKLVFISTDFVFDGKKGDYSENDRANPINAYGKSKLECEKTAGKTKGHLILRVSTLFGTDLKSKKFINYAISSLAGGREICAAADFRRSPTFINDIAEALMMLLEKNETGTFHVAGKSQVTLYEAALTIAEEFGAPKKLVKKCAGNSLGLACNRPLDTSLDISKLNGRNISMHSFLDAIKIIKKRVRNAGENPA